jgi:hypothetical protein
LLLFAWVILLGFFFAMTEIQIEGAHGWAASLPTWRIERHWLLDLFWGGRPMTGYHAWVFPFMFFVFHLPMVIQETFSWRLEARCLGALMLFWICEDFFWFLMNPGYGLARFAPQHIPWHKHWLCGVPTDYLTFTAIGSCLALASYLKRTVDPAISKR